MLAPIPQQLLMPPQQQYVMVPGVGLRMVDVDETGTVGATYSTAMMSSHGLERHLLQQAHMSRSIGLNIRGREKDYRTLPESADGYIYKVQFKRVHRYFLLGPSAPRGIKTGDFVKVEADRGEDLGIVCGKIPCNEFREEKPTAGYRGRGYAITQEDNKRLIRLATDEERVHLSLKFAEENSTLQVCREKVLMRKLPMEIIDAEYQFDHHKLTFFFESDRRIDFRELVSDLFALYKTRIWMQQVDTSFKPEEILAHALVTGMSLEELQHNRSVMTTERNGDFFEHSNKYQEHDYRTNYSPRYGNLLNTQSLNPHCHGEMVPPTSLARSPASLGSSLRLPGMSPPSMHMAQMAQIASISGLGAGSQSSSPSAASRLAPKFLDCGLNEAYSASNYATDLASDASLSGMFPSEFKAMGSWVDAKGYTKGSANGRGGDSESAARARVDDYQTRVRDDNCQNQSVSTCVSSVSAPSTPMTRRVDTLRSHSSNSSPHSNLQYASSAQYPDSMFCHSQPVHAFPGLSDSLKNRDDSSFSFDLLADSLSKIVPAYAGSPGSASTRELDPFYSPLRTGVGVPLSVSIMEESMSPGQSYTTKISPMPSATGQEGLTSMSPTLSPLATAFESFNNERKLPSPLSLPGDSPLHPCSLQGGQSLSTLGSVFLSPPAGSLRSCNQTIASNTELIFFPSYRGDRGWPDN